MKADHLWILVAALCFYFVVPVFLAKVVVRADWGTIAIAYGIWIAVLGIFALLNLGSGIKLDEAVGWPMIMSVFFTIPAIPVLALLMRWAGVR